MADDDEITSTELDELLDAAETVEARRPKQGADVRLYVSVDATTLQALEHRSATQHSELTVVAAEALRAGARVA